MLLSEQKTSQFLILIRIICIFGYLLDAAVLQEQPLKVLVYILVHYTVSRCFPSLLDVLD